MNSSPLPSKEAATSVASKRFPARTEKPLTKVIKAPARTEKPLEEADKIPRKAWQHSLHTTIIPSVASAYRGDFCFLPPCCPLPYHAMLKPHSIQGSARTNPNLFSTPRPQKAIPVTNQSVENDKKLLVSTKKWFIR